MTASSSFDSVLSERSSKDNSESHVIPLPVCLPLIWPLSREDERELIHLKRDGSKSQRSSSDETLTRQLAWRYSLTFDISTASVWPLAEGLFARWRGFAHWPGLSLSTVNFRGAVVQNSRPARNDREVSRLSDTDRKKVCRYVDRARASGLGRDVETVNSLTTTRGADRDPHASPTTESRPKSLTDGRFLAGPIVNGPTAKVTTDRKSRHPRARIASSRN
ncbi:MAG: hypothetical protein EKK34_26005 [Mycobacterium sp.]|nr:MAG: hypothetical protein EKK34_26005 [Mycobacterium sp.]